MLLMLLVVMSAVSGLAASSASALAPGFPSFIIKEGGVLKELAVGEQRPATFTSGEAKLSVPIAGITITCEKDKQEGSDLENFVINEKTETSHAGSANILFEGCKASATCKVNSPGLKGGLILAPVNFVLAYETEAAAKAKTEPIGLIFQATQESVKGTSGRDTFVALEGEPANCVPATKVKATGTEVVLGGKAGVFCKAPKGIQTDAISHEIQCPATAVANAWVYVSGVLVHVEKIGLSAFGFAATQVGNATIKLLKGSKEKELTEIEWSVIP